MNMLYLYNTIDFLCQHQKTRKFICIMENSGMLVFTPFFS